MHQKVCIICQHLCKSRWISGIKDFRLIKNATKLTLVIFKQNENSNKKLWKNTDLWKKFLCEGIKSIFFYNHGILH